MRGKAGAWLLIAQIDDVEYIFLKYPVQLENHAIIHLQSP